MNWEAAGAIGEVVGSIAVLITLVYLAVQVRQNTRHVRAQMGHDGWIATSAHILSAMGDDAATTLAKADLGEAPLTDEDLKVLEAHYRALFWHIARVEHMNAQDLEIYSVEEAAQGFIDDFNSDVGRAWWASNHSLIERLAPVIGRRLGELLEDPESPSRAEALREMRDRLSTERGKTA